ncbi:hypothetical protein BGZ58_001165 [Dissophora ornata]|nr:hypothetical protein BGZ58_001165 [Dissophora ornata]
MADIFSSVMKMAAAVFRPFAHTQDQKELIDNILYHIDARQPTPSQTQVHQPTSIQVQVRQPSSETARGRDNSLAQTVKGEPPQDEFDLSSPTPRPESQSSTSQEVIYVNGEETGVESDDLPAAVDGRRVKAEAQLRLQLEPGNETPAAVESIREYPIEKKRAELKKNSGHFLKPVDGAP